MLSSIQAPTGKMHSTRLPEQDGPRTALGLALRGLAWHLDRTSEDDDIRAAKVEASFGKGALAGEGGDRAQDSAETCCSRCPRLRALRGGITPIVRAGTSPGSFSPHPRA